MKVLGVDLGDRRVGLAVSDEGRTFAFPLRTERVRALDDEVSVVLACAQEQGATLIVIGDPKNMNGRPGPKSAEAQEVAKRLTDAGYSVALWDERLTTAEAERHLKDANLNRKQRKRIVDTIAAQRILESYLVYSQRHPKTE